MLIARLWGSRYDERPRVSRRSRGLRAGDSQKPLSKEYNNDCSGMRSLSTCQSEHSAERRRSYPYPTSIVPHLCLTCSLLCFSSHVSRPWSTGMHRRVVFGLLCCEILDYDVMSSEGRFDCASHALQKSIRQIHFVPIGKSLCQYW